MHDDLRELVIYSLLLPPKGLSVSVLPTLFHNWRSSCTFFLKYGLFSKPNAFPIKYYAFLLTDLIWHSNKYLFLYQCDMRIITVWNPAYQYTIVLGQPMWILITKSSKLGEKICLYLAKVLCLFVLFFFLLIQS